MISRLFQSTSLGLFVLCTLYGGSTFSATEKVIFSFPAGSYPYGRLEQDDAGVLYGTTYDQNGRGTIYQLHEKRGTWKFKVLHSFTGGTDGMNPVAGMTEDHDSGSFYGVTQYGGTRNEGIVYSLIPSGRSWTEKPLYNFTGGSDGSQPQAMMARDKATGDLLGTAFSGGNAGCGTGFILTPSGGNWNFNSLYSFKGGATDGCNPVAQLKPGSKTATWFGATAGGGTNNNGTVFELAETGGIWSEKPIYRFSGGSDGRTPNDLDAADDGTLYGVAEGAGPYGAGVAFQLAPHRNKFRYSVIWSFRGGSDGNTPEGIRLDNHTGTLNGTTTNGGTYGRGTLFALVPQGGSWSKTVLHSFGSGSDGAYPTSRPTLDAQTGNLYGTTSTGGTFNGGTVYEVTP